MITNFSLSALHGINVNDVWFQEDVAICHISHAANDLLRQRFDARLISPNSNVNWRPRSNDMTPLNSFLWGAVKEK